MSTEERLERVERELARARRNRWLLGAGVLAAGILALVWLPAPAEVIPASAFVLVDDKGRERGKWEVGQFGPMLLLLDEKGEPRVSLAVGKVGPGLVLADANGEPRVALAVAADGPALALADAKGKIIWRAP